MITREQIEKIEDDLFKDIDNRLKIMRKVAEISKGLDYIQYFDLQIAGDKGKLNTQNTEDE